MKKAIGVTLLSCMMLLTACGEKETSQPTTSQTEKKEEKSTGQVEKKAKEEKCDYDATEGCVKILAGFKNDDTDDEGIYNLDFNGFKLGIVPLLVNVKLNEEGQMDEKYNGKTEVKAVMFVMQAENTLEDDVDYNGTFTVVTDTGEQLDSDNGIGSANEVVQTYFGKVKATGYDILPLEGDEMPKSIKLLIDPPNKLVDGAYNGNEDLGTERRIDFEKVKID
ncbi:hypothetical protein H7S74_30390 [Priestia aryabhattai]|uniref:hypothetical protein n=1 Tax=Priestia aryabhattai TaxID=412384 RepID=UPI001ED3C649|nr:hypothetical protein [Priestia aryabhattai]MBY0094954.1 hypothetical protein [Priestia aryabhattai]MBY0105605.1 hypothetical protein [Priestia aryabhattai]